MDEEIDLQRYILLLIKSWKWIAGVTILFAVVAALGSFFVLPPTYEARALAVITQPRYLLTFDSRFQTERNTDLDFYKPVAQLAKTDDIIQALYDAWASQGGDPEIDIKALDQMTKVEGNSSTSSVELVVTTDDPEIAAQIVNLWAEIFVQKANDIYDENLDDIGTIKKQVTQARTERGIAQKELIAFESQNELAIFRSRLLTQQSLYDRYLADQSTIEQTLQNLGVFQEQLAELPANQAIPFDIELTALLLQLKAYHLDGTVPQIQIDSQASDSSRTVHELSLYLSQMSQALEQKSSDIDLLLDPLQSEILLLQGQIKELETISELLTQDYQVASDSYLTLSRKLAETQISSQITEGTVKLASGANVPYESVGPRKMVTTLIAAVVGMMVSIFGIFAYDFWINLPKEPQEAAAQQKPAKT
jgi:polysaccharide biosynthesis transport protein